MWKSSARNVMRVITNAPNSDALLSSWSEFEASRNVRVWALDSDSIHSLACG